LPKKGRITSSWTPKLALYRNEFTFAPNVTKMRPYPRLTCRRTHLAGILGFTDTIGLCESDIQGLTIPGSSAKDWQIPVPAVYRRKLIIAVSFFHHASRINKGPVNITSVTRLMFDTYRLSSYDPNDKIKPWTLDPEINSALGSWQKNLKPNKSDFVEFKDESYWIRTKEKYGGSLEACGLEHLIDSAYVPTNTDLDTSQKKWFYKDYKTR
jgi:hypothetical protein